MNEKEILDEHQQEEEKHVKSSEKYFLLFSFLSCISGLVYAYIMWFGPFTVNGLLYPFVMLLAYWPVLPMLAAFHFLGTLTGAPIYYDNQRDKKLLDVYIDNKEWEKADRLVRKHDDAMRMFGRENVAKVICPRR